MPSVNNLILMAVGDYAIVCTLFMPPGEVKPVYSFLSYHLAVGFDHIYLFIDDPSNNDLVTIAGMFGNHVSVLMRGEVLSELQKSVCTLYSRLEKLVDSDVPARQMLNAEYASVLATNSGMKWLLHIDIDEVCVVVISY